MTSNESKAIRNAQLKFVQSKQCGPLHRLLQNAQKNIAEPAFSVDGRYVYFSQDNTPGTVWQYNKDSTGRVFVIKRLDRETGRVEVLIDGAGVLPWLPLASWRSRSRRS